MYVNAALHQCHINIPAHINNFQYNTASAQHLDRWMAQRAQHLCLPQQSAATMPPATAITILIACYRQHQNGWYCTVATFLWVSWSIFGIFVACVHHSFTTTFVHDADVWAMSKQKEEASTHTHMYVVYTYMCGYFSNAYVYWFWLLFVVIVLMVQVAHFWSRISHAYYAMAGNILWQYRDWDFKFRIDVTTSGEFAAF